MLLGIPIWLFVKYCGLAAIVGFVIGTFLAHVIIYKRHFGSETPIIGVSSFGMILVVGLMLGVSSLFDVVVNHIGAPGSVLLGLAFQIVGGVVGFLVRWSFGLGPPPPR